MPDPSPDAPLDNPGPRAPAGAPPPWRWRALRRVLAVGLLLAGSSVGALLWDGRDRYEPAPLGVVLGSKVYPSGRPAPLLRDRLERGLELYREGAVSVLLVSGGRGEEGHEEADVMAAYLIARGVPPSDVLRDRRGWTTFHTAQHTAALLRERGWRRAIAVSTYYHQSRCRLAFERAGVPEVGSARARFRPGPRDLYAIPRELAGWLYYSLRSFPGDDACD